MVDKLLVNAQVLSNYSQIYSDANVERNCNEFVGPYADIIPSG